MKIHITKVGGVEEELVITKVYKIPVCAVDDGKPAQAIRAVGIPQTLTQLYSRACLALRRVKFEGRLAR